MAYQQNYMFGAYPSQQMFSQVPSTGELSSEAACQTEDGPFACLGPDPQLLLFTGEDYIPSFDFEEAVRAAAAHPAASAADQAPEPQQKPAPATINPALLEQPPPTAPLSPQTPSISGSIWGSPSLACLSLPSPIIAASSSADPVLLQESPYATSLTPTLSGLPLPPQQQVIDLDREDSPSIADILSLELDETMGEQPQQQQQQYQPAIPPPAPVAASTGSSGSSSKKRKAGADECGKPSDQGAAKKRRVASSSNTCRECRRKKAKCQPAPDGSGSCTGCVKSGRACVRDGQDGRTHNTTTGEIAASVLDFKRKALCVLYLVWLARTGRLAGPDLGFVRRMLNLDTLTVCHTAARLAESQPDAEALVARIDAAAASGAVHWPGFVGKAEHVATAGNLKLKERRDTLEAFHKESRALLMRLRVVLGAAMEEDGLLRDSGLLSESAVLVAIGKVLCNDMHTHPSDDQLEELASNSSQHLDRPETYGYYDLAQFSSVMIARACMSRFTDHVKNNFPAWDGFGKFDVWASSEFSAKDGFK